MLRESFQHNAITLVDRLNVCVSFTAVQKWHLPIFVLTAKGLGVDAPRALAERGHWRNAVPEGGVATCHMAVHKHRVVRIVHLLPYQIHRGSDVRMLFGC